MDSTTSGVTTTLYIGSVEKITQADGSKEIKRYIGGVAIMTLALDTGGATQSSNTHYLYKDHLGSLDIITDAAGSIVQEQSFDAWGQRRDAVNWQDLLSAQLTGFNHSVTTRGFTGHEMLDEVGIIHMNGRIYDPKLGRFLQADPFIQEPTNTQSLNRYSYVLNNPLNATDPSGFLSFGDALKIVVSIAVAVFAPEFLGAYGGVFGTAASPSLFAYATAGAFAGAITGGAKGAAMGAFSGLVFGAIGLMDFGGNVDVLAPLAHGFGGGIMSLLQGGKFGHGFISASVTKGVGMRVDIQSQLVKGIIMAALGGTLSEMSGGGFANGAITAAFAYAFNEVSQYRRAAQRAAEANNLMMSKSDQELLSMSKNDLYDRSNKQAMLSGKQGEIAAGVRNSEIARWHSLHAVDISPDDLKYGFTQLATAVSVGAICTGTGGAPCLVGFATGTYSVTNEYYRHTTSQTLSQRKFGAGLGSGVDVVLDVMGARGLVKAPIRFLSGDPLGATSALPGQVVSTANYVEKLNQ